MLSQRAFGSGAAQPARDVRFGTELTNTALGSFSQLDQIDMLSPSLGYALATRTVGKSGYQYYLVRTVNLARTWTVVSEIPGVDDRYPIFTDFDTDDSDPFIYFANRNVGYVDGTDGLIYVTDDGGRTWKSIASRRVTSSYGVSGDTTSVVTDSCTSGGPLSCRGVLSEYPLGSATAETSRVIPTKGVDYGSGIGLLAVGSGSAQVIDLSNDNLSMASSLQLTRNDGLTWQTLDNPCSGSMIQQMIVENNGQWLLSCFHDYGMYHGTAQIFRSSDQGATWTTVLDDTPQKDVLGDLGATPVYLFFNGDDRILYGAMMGPAGGLMTSTDGGTDWTSDRLFSDTSGSPGSLSNFGPTDSIYQVFQGPAYVTRNGHTWRMLPQLPAGTYKGMSICTDRKVTSSVHVVTRTGLDTLKADFTNTSDKPCYLDGAPNVQPLNVGGVGVGPSLTTELINSNGDFVVLEAKGGEANVSMDFDPTIGIHPPSSCKAARVRVLHVAFGSPSSFYFRLTSQPKSVCRVAPSIFISSVKRGRGWR